MDHRLGTPIYILSDLISGEKQELVGGRHDAAITAGHVLRRAHQQACHFARMWRDDETPGLAIAQGVSIPRKCVQAISIQD